MNIPQAPDTTPWNVTKDVLFWIDPDPGCPDHCEGSGSQLIVDDPYPMYVPCNCTCRAWRLISRILPCVEFEGSD